MPLTTTSKQIEALETLPRETKAFSTLVDVIKTNMNEELDAVRKSQSAHMHRASYGDRSAEISALMHDGRRRALEDVKRLLDTLVLVGDNHDS